VFNYSQYREGEIDVTSFRIAGAVIILILALAACAQPSNGSGNGFTTVNAPGGGQYIYGPFPGEGSMPDAVLYMLRSIHQYFGNRPELGKFVQSRDGTQTAAFFAVNAKAAGDKPMTGLFIVARSADGSASGAVVFDERSHFATSEPGMMRALYSVWHPTGINAAAASATSQTAATPIRAGAAGDAAAPLVQTSGGDHSASIGLPEGWKIVSLNGGAISVAGPNGEMVNLGGVFQGYTLGSDLFQSYVAIVNRLRAGSGKPPATYTVLERTNLPGNAIQVILKLDLSDGVGPRRGSIRLGRWGAQAMSVDGSNLPERLVERENATLLAVIRSYQPNRQAMAQLQQGAMNRVQADAARANQQAAAINARREASTAAFNQHMDNLNAQSQSFNAHMDNIDRASKITQDYILDRSVVRDTENGDRATVSNGYADSLVRANPDRFQVVPSQNLLAGKDY
jgi:hypothetical protein